MTPDQAKSRLHLAVDAYRAHRPEFMKGSDRTVSAVISAIRREGVRRHGDPDREFIRLDAALMGYLDWESRHVLSHYEGEPVDPLPLEGMTAEEFGSYISRQEDRGLIRYVMEGGRLHWEASEAGHRFMDSVPHAYPDVDLEFRKAWRKRLGLTLLGIAAIPFAVLFIPVHMFWRWRREARRKRNVRALGIVQGNAAR